MLTGGGWGRAGTGTLGRVTVRVAIAGSTGSIGTQTLDVLAAESDQYELVAIGASGRDLDALVAQAETHRPKVVAVADEAAGRVLVDRLTWLAMSAPNGQVRAVASLKLQRLGARLRAAGAGKSESDVAQDTLLAADIKRFLERPSGDPAKIINPLPAPPGAPIGDMGQDWLFSPMRCQWDDNDPGAWVYFQPPM